LLELVGATRRSSPPILFGLALHRWCCRILALYPVPRAAADIRRAEPLRHDALEAELAGVAENDVTTLRDAAKTRFRPTTNGMTLPRIRPGTSAGAGALRQIEYLAGLDDYGMAVAAYWAAVESRPKVKITLRQGIRVVVKNWSEAR
jgi:hypothetical protein